MLKIKPEQIEGDYKDYYLLYTRRSTDDANNQKNSIEYQELECLKYIKDEKLVIAPVTIEGFCENGIIKEHHSGFKEDEWFEILEDGAVKQKVERPKFLALATLLQKKLFKGVICLCWDRISRNEADDVIIKKLMRQGVNIEFVQASYEMNSSGQLHMDIDGMFSRHYSRIISEKVKMAFKKLRNEGRCIYHSPIGYIDHGSESKILDPVRAPIVKEIFEKYATGEWSCTSLATWANQRGLTTKPFRRRRTETEMLNNLDNSTIPKISRPVTRKSIENILTNPFYIGKLLYTDQWKESKAHPALIDTALFFKVQEILAKKTVSVHYPNPLFFLYKGLLSCGECGRKYSPYKQKEITYYKSRCKPFCSNAVQNISEAKVTEQLLEEFKKIYFTDCEKITIKLHAQSELNKLTDRRNKELEDLYAKYNKALSDYDFLAAEKLSLIRTNVMSLEDIAKEEFRLKNLTTMLQVRIASYADSCEHMLAYIITFTELMENAVGYFKAAVDSDKRYTVLEVFVELKISDGKLKCVAKPAYDILLKRHDDPKWQIGSPNYLFVELLAIYSLVKQSKESLESLVRRSNHNKRAVNSLA